MPDRRYDRADASLNPEFRRMESLRAVGPWAHEDHTGSDHADYRADDVPPVEAESLEWIVRMSAHKPNAGGRRWSDAVESAARP